MLEPALLFAYGTLQDPDILRAVLGVRATQVMRRPARLPDHAVVVYPGRTYPALVFHRGSLATGLLLGPLADSDWLLLDAFEGSEYRRAAMEALADGAVVPAFAYLPTVALHPEQPRWHLGDWALRHKQAMLATAQADPAGNPEKQ